MPASNYFRNVVAGLFDGTNATAFTPHVALFNGDPSGAGSEVTTTIRPAGRVVASFGAPSPAGTIQNDAIVNFGTAAGGATVTHFAIYDAVSAGNLIAYATLTGGTQAISTGNTVSFPIGDLDIIVT